MNAVVQLPYIRKNRSYGGIAVNEDGTRFASVDTGKQCVRVYDMECVSVPVVISPAGRIGSTGGLPCR